MNAVPTPIVEWRWQGQRIRNGSLANVGEALFLIREEAAASEVEASPEVISEPAMSAVVDAAVKKDRDEKAAAAAKDSKIA